MVPPRVLAASPANRIVPTCFRPGVARLPPHPASSAPTTRHDLASVRRTKGEYNGCKGAGITWRKKERCHTRTGENEAGYRNAGVAREIAWIPACAGMTAVGGAGMTAVGQDGWCHTLGVTPAAAGVHLSTSSGRSLGPGLRRGDRCWVGQERENPVAGGWSVAAGLRERALASAIMQPTRHGPPIAPRRPRLGHGDERILNAQNACRPAMKVWRTVMSVRTVKSARAPRVRWPRSDSAPMARAG
jgi:hypothetical protein